MRRFASGDGESFATLYRRYEGAVYGFCLRYLGDPDGAADAFQETFVRVIDARHRYRPRGKFKSWLFTIARRVCADHYRRLSRTQAPLEAVHSTPSQVAARGSSEGALMARDEIVRLLAALPADQREALLLSRWYGFTYREIAEMSNSTEAAVKQRVYRALVTLRRGGVR
ncbi:MAG: RNA polymerase sigma factor SigK [Gemmatimonadales bacterium]|nr:MAG: RNA polymerase sigma factor SigK [Gemmatimonadales bacterium]